MKKSFLWLFLALISYLLPWVVLPASALTMGGYDLAEWLSLHPAARADSLLLPLLLRLPLALLALLIIAQFHLPRWLRLAALGIVCIALLPPLEFVRNTSDINYQQQFALAALTLFFGGAVWLFVPTRLHQWLVAALLIGLILCGVLGSLNAVTLMQVYRLPVDYGIGGFLLATAGGLGLIGIMKAQGDR